MSAAEEMVVAEFPPVTIPGVEPGSLEERLRAAGERSAAQKTVDLPIPGYEGRLWGTFKALRDWSAVRAISKGVENFPTEDEQEICGMADVILKSCTTTFAREEDGDTPLDMPLGMELAVRLGYIDARNDREALFLLFRAGTASIAKLFGLIEGHFENAKALTDEEQAGNSVAPS